jgi:hypothetical protein
MEVYAAAEADGAYLPMIKYTEKSEFYDLSGAEKPDS